MRGILRLRQLISAALAVAVITGCGEPQTSQPYTGSGQTRQGAPATLTGDMIASALRSSGLPIAEVRVFTAETDPNKLLGRPGQYTAKVSWKDQRARDTEDATVELYPEREAMERRAKYIEELGRQSTLLLQYVYSDPERGAVLRVPKDLTPEQAKDYQTWWATVGTQRKFTPSAPVVLAAPSPAPTQEIAGPVVPTALPVATRAASTQPTAQVPAGVSNANRGITFGKPITLGTGQLAVAAVLATNTTDQVKSFTVKATYRKGAAILGTALGAVNDMRPGQQQAVMLAGIGGIPVDADTVRVDMDTMVREARSTPGAEAAAKITFGRPTVRGTGPLTLVEVEATNGDTAIHSFTVQAAFLRGGELIGVGTGAVNDIAAGQIKTASLAVQGTTTGSDAVVVTVDTMVR